MLKAVASVKDTVIRRGLTSSARKNVNYKLAPLQEAALEEKCILVDESDNILGQESKRNCHRVGENENIPLHRAFSVFLFNKKGDLLLQKRSEAKITFPGHYTNTCCSHPLMEIPGEVEETDSLGIKRAAVRRLNYELGIPTNEIKLNEFYYLTRIHYKDLGDNVWGEHEIDYILFLQKNNISLNPNPDEVSEIKWVSKSMINEFVKKCESPLTPWFKLILKNKLPLWWDNLNNLDQMKDHNNIQRF